MPSPTQTVEFALSQAQAATVEMLLVALVAVLALAVLILNSKDVGRDGR